jgi:hypothetical protein
MALNEENSLMQGELESLLKGFLLKHPEETPKRNNALDKPSNYSKLGGALIPGGGPFNQNDYLRIAGEPISPKERTPSRGSMNGGSRTGSRVRQMHTQQISPQLEPRSVMSHGTAITATDRNNNE